MFANNPWLMPMQFIENILSASKSYFAAVSTYALTELVALCMSSIKCNTLKHRWGLGLSRTEIILKPRGLLHLAPSISCQRDQLRVCGSAQVSLILVGWRFLLFEYCATTLFIVLSQQDKATHETIFNHRGYRQFW